MSKINLKRKTQEHQVFETHPPDRPSTCEGKTVKRNCPNSQRRLDSHIKNIRKVFHFKWQTRNLGQALGFPVKKKTHRNVTELSPLSSLRVHPTKHSLYVRTDDCIQFLCYLKWAKSIWQGGLLFNLYFSPFMVRHVFVPSFHCTAEEQAKVSVCKSLWENQAVKI